MYTYHFYQWLLFFYLYCFLGWVWESCYVSAKSRKWVNRGFLHGPMLPIYGSGAIIVLVSTLPVRENIPLVFLFGMVGATVLEYITGALMEKLFGVRYWDYSDQFCNLNGHICLVCSLAWGVFSVLMVQYAHKPFEYVILLIPDQIGEILAFCISVVFVADFTVSFQAALDLKELLTSLRDNNEEIRRLAKRLDVMIAVMDDDRTEFMEKMEAHIEQGRERIEQGRERIEQSRERIEQGRERIEHSREKIEEQARERMEQTLRTYAGRLEDLEIACRERFGSERADENRQLREKVRAEMEEIRERISQAYRRMPERKNRKSRRVAALLRRNPGAVSGKFQEWLDELRREAQEQKNESSQQGRDGGRGSDK